MLDEPFKYLKHVRKVHKKFVEDFEKKVSSQKMKLKMGLEYSDKTPFFGLKLFFKVL